MKLYAISILFLFLVHTVPATASSAQGKNFWFGFLHNYSGTNDVYTIIASTSSSSITGTISVPGLNWSQNFTVLPNATVQITMPAGTQPGTIEGVYNNAVHIVSSDSVIVYAQNDDLATSDASFIFPSEGLGYKYIADNWEEPLSLFSDEISIVASENNTQIQITPSVATSGGHPAGVPYTVTLNRGDAYLITKGSSVSDSVSLTGTKIEVANGNGCTPFAVFGGHMCANLNGCYACDHLYEQLLPNSGLGTNYILPPLKEKDTTIYKVVALANGTNVIINNGPPITLNAGEFYIFKNNIASSVTANDKIMIMQFAEGYTCDNAGDPFQILMYNNHQMIDKTTFKTIVLDTSYWVNIVTKTSDVANTVLDGLNIGTSFSPVPSDPVYSYARNRLSAGDHHLSNPGGFLAYVYAWSSYNSYGFCAGANLSNSLSITATGGTICKGDSIVLTAESNLSLNGHYTWSPGGDTGSTIRVSPTETTTYAVTYTPGTGCFYGTVTDTAVVTVLPKADITVSSNSPVCLGDSLKLMASGGKSYLWSGPNGFSSDEQNPFISNTSIINSGVYTLMVTDSNGCSTADQTNVTIYAKPQIKILLESDTTQLCMGDEITLRGTGADKYRWRSKLKLNDDEQGEITTILSEPYNVIYLTGFNQWNCSDTATITFKAGNCCQMFVPNAFSPNGDGLNDKFGVKANGHPRSFLLEIFNRWGQLVFIGHTPEELWNGTFNNQHLDIDTYFYRLSGKCANGTPFEKSGSVNLIR
ncbi:MAG TPA: gliding motility-associated C-terminal domain-containing protein [Edaphocola sp.]|nr:gliding motility-associated C-terminal domain-containing protein [Edaphocola sp.]